MQMYLPILSLLTNIGVIVLTGYAIYITQSAWAGLLLIFLFSVKSRNDDDKDNNE